MELALAMAITTILLGAMTSAVLLASHALPDEDDLSERTAAAIATLDRISSDLALATSFIAAESSRVRFNVPDRGHGDPGLEKIVYKWAGTPGDPLLLRYNACPNVTLCESVQEFSLEYVPKAKPLQHTPRVLLVVNDSNALESQESDKLDLIESWGFPVEVITDDESADTYTAMLSTSDVMYISETVLSSDMVETPYDTDRGIVTEEAYLYDELGISETAHTTYGNHFFWVADNTHEITAGLKTGAVQVFEFFMKHTYADGALAPGAQVLSQWPGYDPTTVVIEVGAELWGGGQAGARRVGLLWGYTDFDVNGLTDVGHRLVRRAIVWAAAPVGISSIRITLQLDADASSRLQTQVQLVNLPEVS